MKNVILEFSRNTKKIIKRSGCEFIVNDILKLCNSKTINSRKILI